MVKYVIKPEGDKFTVYSVAETNFGGDAWNFISEHDSYDDAEIRRKALYAFSNGDRQAINNQQ